MNSTDFLNDNRCRACLQPHGNKSLGEMVNVCETETALIYEILESICSVKVAIDDGYPQKICKPCEDSLVKALLFKITCKKSSEFLKSMNTECAYVQENKLESVEVIDCPDRYNIDNINNDQKYSKGSEHSDYAPDNFSAKQLQYYDLHESANDIDSRTFQHHVYTQPTNIDNTSCVDSIITTCKNNQIKQALNCYVCHTKFEDKNEMSIHLKLHTLDGSKCNNKFITLEDREEHEEKQHSIPNLNVGDFQSPKYVSENRRTCEECGKVFQYRASMLKHLKKHNSLPKSCNYCDFIPEHPSRLGQHMDESHSHLKNISCATCGKTFFKASNLRLHMAVHSGTKRHICEICGISFALACNLTAHRRLHTGERPYTCKHCGRRFTQQSALRSHEACHSDKREHICVDCGAAFSRAGALNNHRKRHLSTKSYVCTLCGKAFTFSSERKRHMTIHSGDRNHICDICGRRFNRSTNLKVHRRIHTGETPYVCNVCGKGFIQSHCLKTHMNIHNTLNM